MKIEREQRYLCYQDKKKSFHSLMAAKIEKKGESIVRKVFKSYDQNQEI